MRQREVIERLRAEARRRDLEFEITQLTRHVAVRVGGTTKTLGRHREVDEVTARRFWDQFAEVLGKGWWR